MIPLLTKVRLRIAGNMLRNTNCSVQEISDRIGFSDISHFGHLFKRSYGLSPSAYRNHN